MVVVEFEDLLPEVGVVTVVVEVAVAVVVKVVVIVVLDFVLKEEVERLL